MKTRKPVVAGIAIAIVLFGLFSACTLPSPVFGQWVDNDGNKLVMNSDSSFLMTLKSDSRTVTYEGSYKLISNAVTFNLTTGRVIVSEWDIRGSVLKLIVPDPSSGQPKTLQLYQVGK